MDVQAVKRSRYIRVIPVKNQSGSRVNGFKAGGTADNI